MIGNNIHPDDMLGSAVRYENINGSKWFSWKKGRLLYIEPAPLKYLKQLNGYDQHQVCKGIEALASVPNPMDGMVNTQRPAFFKAKEAIATVFNFIIKYQVTAKAVVVSGISLNFSALGKKEDSKSERQNLYIAKKSGQMKFSEDISPGDAKLLPATWKTGVPVTKVKTQHAAVNGMLNNLDKATWLMGVHADHAYKDDDFDKYTLFHNPHESPALDFYESVKDNWGFATPLAKHLAAILLDVQLTGQPVKWVAHSQGAIIFKQAVAHHIKLFPGQTLNKNSVTFHSGGHNKKVTNKLLSVAGIRKENPDNDNPFDMVPNIAGGNNLGYGGIKRSIQLSGKVLGVGDPPPIESPHTLPFISLEAYHRFLTLAGDNKSAAKVKKHMDKLTNQ